MRVVLDTNVLLVSLPRNSQYRLVFDSLLASKLDLVVSHEILSEYIEVISEKASPSVATNIAELLLNLSNVHQVEVFYRWNLISEDPEDNKFVDAAVSGNADFIVTNDRHFSVLAAVEFPKVNFVSLVEFIEMLTSVRPAG